MPSLKYCPCCKELKFFTEFHVNKSRGDGRGAYCKICARKIREQYYKRNRRKEIIKSTQYRLLHSGERAEYQAKYSARYRKDYKEKLAEDKAKRVNIHKTKIDKIARKKGCIACGTHVGRLHWHHRPNEIKVCEVSRMVAHKFSVIEKEIEKCDILCSSCHIRLHRFLEGCRLHNPSGKFLNYLIHNYRIH